MNLLSKSTVLSTFILLSAIAGHVHAQIAVDFSGNLNNGYQASLTLGWKFEVSETIVIDGMGFFDDFGSDGPGLQNDHRIGLWTDEPNPRMLAETLVNNESEAEPAIAENGRWLMNDVSPIVLEPGTYLIGAHTPHCTSNCDRFRMFTNAVSIPQVTLLEAGSAPDFDAPFSFQERRDGFFGPTFRVMKMAAPSTMEIIRGTHVSGSQRNLRESDNVDVSLQRSMIDVQAKTSIELTASSPVASPSQMLIAMEASVFARSRIIQQVQLYDYLANQWEEIDSRAANRFSDGISRIDINSPARFVDATTMLMKARISFESSLRRQQFSSDIDQFVWMIGE